MFTSVCAFVLRLGEKKSTSIIYHSVAEKHDNQANIITSAVSLKVMHILRDGPSPKEQEEVLVRAYSYSCERVDEGGGEVDVVEGVSEVEKLKRQKDVCHAKTATAHLSAFGPKERDSRDGRGQTDVKMERWRGSVKGRIKRTAAIMMRPPTGRTLSPSSLLSSMSNLL